MNVMGGMYSMIVMMFYVWVSLSVLVLCVSSIVMVRLVIVIVRKCMKLFYVIGDEKFYSVLVRYENVVE